jgi:hypothetical protein
MTSSTPFPAGAVWDLSKYRRSVDESACGALRSHAAAKFQFGFSVTVQRGLTSGIKSHHRQRAVSHDFAGSSTELREGRPDTTPPWALPSLSAQLRWQATGRPGKAAEALLRIVATEPPLRLCFGSDALAPPQERMLWNFSVRPGWKISASTKHEDYSSPSWPEWECTRASSNQASPDKVPPM